MCECQDVVCLSIPRAAKLVGVDQELVRSWVKSGQLLRANVPGIKQIRIRRCDLHEFLAPKTPADSRSSLKSTNDAS